MLTRRLRAQASGGQIQRTRDLDQACLNLPRIVGLDRELA